MLRHIAWFNETAIEPNANGELDSPDSAVRHRCLLPARMLENMGIPCSVFGNLHHADPTHVAQHLQKLQTDVVIISNIQGLTLLNLARMAKHLGCYVVVDFADSNLTQSHYDKFIGISDLIVTTTEAVATAFRTDALHALAIPDCTTETADKAAHLWKNSLTAMKTKPPHCANSNEPLPHND
jgi:hypothetical protein